MKSDGMRRPPENEKRSYPFQKSLKFLSAVSLAMALATGSEARPFTGTVSFSLAGLPPLVARGTGSGNSPGTVSILTASWAATGPILLTLSPSAASPLTAIRIAMTAPGPCVVLPGPCALDGTANGMIAGAPFLVVPLSGLGQTARHSFGGYGSYFDAQAWQTGTVPITINGATLATNYGALMTMFGYDNRSGGGAGVVKLVAPGGLMSNLGGNLPLYVSMTLNFIVPEPETLLLLGLGVAGLAAEGRRRRAR